MINVHIRWMIRRDMREVFDIENQSFESPWSEEDFLRCLRSLNCIGKVAECDEQVVGFMIYELHKSRLHILNFAVKTDARRKSVGTQMVNRLIDKLSHQRRQRIRLEIRETNLAGQQFFRSTGFRAVSILPAFYGEHDGEDAYLMEYRYHQTTEITPTPALMPKNRMAMYFRDR